MNSAAPKARPFKVQGSKVQSFKKPDSESLAKYTARFDVPQPLEPLNA
jgi:hypothetical protein